LFLNTKKKIGKNLSEVIKNKSVDIIILDNKILPSTNLKNLINENYMLDSVIEKRRIDVREIYKGLSYVVEDVYVYKKQ
jgi:hypothetical protein